MTKPPDNPKLYHITHVKNLGGIVEDGRLVSDREMIRRGGPVQGIGMSEIKRRRVEELNVPCHKGTKVGDYVPFYFCPRSIMLYVIYRANKIELTYRGGQRPILHLEADLHRVIEWAVANRVLWAFSLSNAGARYAEFRSRISELDQLDWRAIAATDFRRPRTKETKQAEFLIHGEFPLELVERIGVQSGMIQKEARAALEDSDYDIPVELMPGWYF